MDIYSYIKENFNIDVKDYTFKRDYIKDPLKMVKNPINFGKKYEFIDKNDLEYLYKIINLSIEKCSKMLNISVTALKQQLKYYNIQEHGMN